MNDRFHGYVGKRLQVQQAEERRKQLLGLRDKAVQERDPDTALEVLSTLTAEEQQEQHQKAWSEALDVYQKFDADPKTKPIVNGLAGRDYGKLAGGNGTLAAILYKADLAQNVIDHLPAWEQSVREEAEAAVEKKLRPVIEREMRAKLLGEDVAPDTGAGGAPDRSADIPRTLPAFRAWVAGLSSAEYARREPEIDRAAAGFARRRAPSH